MHAPPRPAGGPHGATMLTPELFSRARKRRKVLPASANKNASSHVLWQLDKTYRFYCSTSTQWVVSDEVGYDERLGTFQCVREYQRAVRPRGGLRNKINFWPQLGVGDVEYKAIMASPADPYSNPPEAFMPTGRRLYAPTGDTAPQDPGLMPPPPLPVLGNPVTAQRRMEEWTDDGMSDTGSYRGTRSVADESTMFQDQTTVGGDDKSTLYEATERGENSSLFDATEATSAIGDRQSVYEATEKGSVMDAGEAADRAGDFAVPPPVDRVALILADLPEGTNRGTVERALAEYDSLPALPRRGSQQYSKWMKSFSKTYGFMPDILITKFPK